MGCPRRGSLSSLHEVVHSQVAEMALVCQLNGNGLVPKPISGPVS